MAAYLAKAGVKCAVFERELFPAAARGRVARAVVHARVQGSRFPGGDGGGQVPAASTAPPGRPATRRPCTTMDWEGPRTVRTHPEADASASTSASSQAWTRTTPITSTAAKFDMLLLQHAERARRRRSTRASRVSGVDFRDERPAARQVHDRRQGDRDARAHGGRRERPAAPCSATSSSCKIKDPVFDQFAIHTWFEGFDRAALATEGGAAATTSSFTSCRSPTPGSGRSRSPTTITSIGVVTQKKNFAEDEARRARTFFWECVASRPRSRGALRRREQVRPFKEEGDYSYAMTQIAGDRFAHGRRRRPVRRSDLLDRREHRAQQRALRAPGLLAALETATFAARELSRPTRPRSAAARRTGTTSSRSTTG